MPPLTLSQQIQHYIAQEQHTFARGVHGPGAGLVQQVLNKLGASIGDDEIFGEQTQLAVLWFQYAWNAWDSEEPLEEDGIVGTKTWEAMQSAVDQGLVIKFPKALKAQISILQRGRYRVKAKIEGKVEVKLDEPEPNPQPPINIRENRFSGANQQYRDLAVSGSNQFSAYDTILPAAKAVADSVWVAFKKTDAQLGRKQSEPQDVQDSDSDSDSGVGLGFLSGYARAVAWSWSLLGSKKTEKKEPAPSTEIPKQVEPNVEISAKRSEASSLNAEPIGISESNSNHNIDAEDCEDEAEEPEEKVVRPAVNQPSNPPPAEQFDTSQLVTPSGSSAYAIPNYVFATSESTQQQVLAPIASDEEPATVEENVESTEAEKDEGKASGFFSHISPGLGFVPPTRTKIAKKPDNAVSEVVETPVPTSASSDGHRVNAFMPDFRGASDGAAIRKDSNKETVYSRATTRVPAPVDIEEEQSTEEDDPTIAGSWSLAADWSLPNLSGGFKTFRYSGNLEDDPSTTKPSSFKPTQKASGGAVVKEASGSEIAQRKAAHKEQQLKILFDGVDKRDSHSYRNTPGGTVVAFEPKITEQEFLYALRRAMEVAGKETVESGLQELASANPSVFGQRKRRNETYIEASIRLANLSSANEAAAQAYVRNEGPLNIGDRLYQAVKGLGTGEKGVQALMLQIDGNNYDEVNEQLRHYFPTSDDPIMDEIVEAEHSGADEKELRFILQSGLCELEGGGFVRSAGEPIPAFFRYATQLRKAEDTELLSILDQIVRCDEDIREAVEVFYEYLYSQTLEGRIRQGGNKHVQEAFRQAYVNPVTDASMAAYAASALDAVLSEDGWFSELSRDECRLLTDIIAFTFESDPSPTWDQVCQASEHKEQLESKIYDALGDADSDGAEFLGAVKRSLGSIKTGKVGGEKYERVAALLGRVMSMDEADDVYALLKDESVATIEELRTQAEQVYGKDKLREHFLSLPYYTNWFVHEEGAEYVDKKEWTSIGQTGKVPSPLMALYHLPDQNNKYPCADQMYVGAGAQKKISPALNAFYAIFHRYYEDEKALNAAVASIGFESETFERQYHELEKLYAGADALTFDQRMKSGGLFKLFNKRERASVQALSQTATTDDVSGSALLKQRPNLTAAESEFEAYFADLSNTVSGLIAPLGKEHRISYQLLSDLKAATADVRATMAIHFGDDPTQWGSLTEAEFEKIFDEGARKKVADAYQAFFSHLLHLVDENKTNNKMLVNSVAMVAASVAAFAIPGGAAAALWIMRASWGTRAIWGAAGGFAGSTAANFAVGNSLDSSFASSVFANTLTGLLAGIAEGAHLVQSGVRKGIIEGGGRWIANQKFWESILIQSGAWFSTGAGSSVAYALVEEEFWELYDKDPNAAMKKLMMSAALAGLIGAGTAAGLFGVLLPLGRGLWAHRGAPKKAFYAFVGDAVDGLKKFYGSGVNGAARTTVNGLLLIAKSFGTGAIPPQILAQMVSLASQIQGLSQSAIAWLKRVKAGWVPTKAQVTEFFEKVLDGLKKPLKKFRRRPTGGPKPAGPTMGARAAAMWSTGVRNAQAIGKFLWKPADGIYSVYLKLGKYFSLGSFRNAMEDVLTKLSSELGEQAAKGFRTITPNMQKILKEMGFSQDKLGLSELLRALSGRDVRNPLSRAYSEKELRKLIGKLTKKFTKALTEIDGVKLKDLVAFKEKYALHIKRLESAKDLAIKIRSWGRRKRNNTWRRVRKNIKDAIETNNLDLLSSEAKEFLRLHDLLNTLRKRRRILTAGEQKLFAELDNVLNSRRLRKVFNEYNKLLDGLTKSGKVAPEALTRLQKLQRIAWKPVAWMGRKVINVGVWAGIGYGAYQSLRLAYKWGHLEDTWLGKGIDGLNWVREGYDKYLGDTPEEKAEKAEQNAKEKAEEQSIEEILNGIGEDLKPETDAAYEKEERNWLQKWWYGDSDDDEVDVSTEEETATSSAEPSSDPEPVEGSAENIEPTAEDVANYFNLDFE